MTKLYKCKDFNKTGYVKLPRRWLDEFDLKPGNQAEIFYYDGSIIIKSPDNPTVHNIRMVSEKGAVLIPKEIQNLIGLSPLSEYCILVDEDHERFVITIFDEKGGNP
ncbi:AbrB/MazE/SpoVT family DNA-binding domain-containing protein [Falsibacillus albus]|uniref:AbrB/MazE/SpoVT family DNA-binding domain-containing protein n=1 Tax=Falsibacillus albus TaxID=2478915 RepID=A0A3L7JXF6_9BACI|nr:hypothetical protein [Falsibacillus albus]RLQ95423.1 hypothetical protein D9X91_10325 [Falsibacillus albus]